MSTRRNSVLRRLLELCFGVIHVMARLPTEILLALLTMLAALSVWHFTRRRREVVSVERKERSPGGSASDFEAYAALLARI